MHVAMPVPTEARAIERHLSFRAKIAEAAERLAESKRPAPKPVALEPEAIPAETDPPPVSYLCSRCAARVSDPEAYPTIKRIQIEVAAYYGIPRIDMTSRRRTANVVLPRQIAMYIVKILTVKSLPEIGRYFGGKDHTTILHAIRKITGRLPHDADLAAQVAHLFNVITGEPA